MFASQTSKSSLSLTTKVADKMPDKEIFFEPLGHVNFWTRFPYCERFVVFDIIDGEPKFGNPEHIDVISKIQQSKSLLQRNEQLYSIKLISSLKQTTDGACLFYSVLNDLRFSKPSSVLLMAYVNANVVRKGFSITFTSIDENSYKF